MRLILAICGRGLHNMSKVFISYRKKYNKVAAEKIREFAIAQN